MIPVRSWPIAQRALDYYRSDSRNPMPYVAGLSQHQRSLFHGMVATLRGGVHRTPDRVWADQWGLP